MQTVSLMPVRVACRAETPLGVFTAIYEDNTICRVLFPHETTAVTAFDDTLPFAAQIKEYFCGERRRFNLPLLIPGTPFRQSVYRTVLNIPYGQAATYSEVALVSGHPLAMRAVGTAMKRNPLPLLIPCHRVVHKATDADAYSGGLNIKHSLQALEARYI